MNRNAPVPMRDEFLSEEDLDLQSLTLDEVMAHWDLWFRQAQATNDADEWTYSHGVFGEVPEVARAPMGRPGGPRGMERSGP